MVNQRVAFGRRGAAPRPAVRATKTAEPPRAAAVALPGAAAPPLPPVEARRDDEELRAWKRERRRNFQIPWRQVSLMATLCFGIGAFVLPSSVNSAVQWLLYALMGASFYAGIRRRKRAT